MRRAGGSMRSQVSVRCWPRPWLAVSQIRKPFGQDATSRPGSGWCRSSTRAGARKGSAVSKQGDRYLRGLFVAGALAVIRYAKIHGTKQRPWLTALLARRPTKVAAIALANKIARMVWAMMASSLSDLGLRLKAESNFAVGRTATGT